MTFYIALLRCCTLATCQAGHKMSGWPSKVGIHLLCCTRLARIGHTAFCPCETEQQHCYTGWLHAIYSASSPAEGMPPVLR